MLLKSTSVTASEERAPWSTVKRINQKRHYNWGSLCRWELEGGLETVHERMWDCQSLRSNCDYEPQAVLPSTSWTSQPWHIRSFNPDPKVGYSHLCLRLLRASSIFPKAGAQCGRRAVVRVRSCQVEDAQHQAGQELDRIFDKSTAEMRIPFYSRWRHQSVDQTCSHLKILTLQDILQIL